jgi:hypothetical protein
VKAALTRRRTLAIVAFTLAALLSPTGRVEACGPFFYDEVFIRPHQPDDLAAFTKGKLGLIQPGFDSNEYAVAFRYLNGGSLDKAEQNSVQPPEPNFDRMTPEEWKAYEAAQKAAEESTPPKLWQKARAEYLPSVPAPNQDIAVDLSSGNFHYQSNFLNCSDHAFQTATLTIRKRAATWGKSSLTLLDWVHAQDAVFSNCNGKDASMPAAAPSNSPALLRADRAYQIAAANFYAQKFNEAARQFTAIAADKDSPWQEWGNYLAARATVRKAFVESKGANAFSEDRADFDTATMQQAQHILERERASPHPQPSRFDLEAELNFIRIRTEPEKRATEICAALAGPAPDSHFKQNLEDLSWMLSNNLPASFKTQPPLLTWIAAWRNTVMPQDTYALWQQTHALPWLVVSIAKSNVKSDSAAIPDLLTAAAAIPTTSPAYQTVFYHRVRLLLESGHLDQARALLDPALAAIQSSKPDSWRNALLAERLSGARDFNEFLTYSPRTALETGSQSAIDLRAGCQNRAGIALYAETTAPCPELDHPLTFDDDATTILNEKTPLSRLIEAARSPILPANLRQNIAIVAWTRAVLLDDPKSAAALVPLLPKALSITAHTSFGFPAIVTILRNDGIQPILDPGIARVASYNQFDQYRYNWWCQIGAPQQSYGESHPKPALPAPTALFTASEQQQAAAEYTRLKSLPNAPNFLGQQVLAYAKTHPSDPLVPEALHFTVRATRYGCPTDERPLSKAAFQLLHKNFPNSPWTAKTPYYF